MRYLVLLVVLFSMPVTAQVSLHSIVERWTNQPRLGADRFMPQWTPEEESEEIAHLKEILVDLAALPADLPSADRINQQLLTFLAEDALFNLEFGSHHFPLNSEGGFLAGIVYRLYGKKVTDREAFTTYLAELRTLPDYFTWQEQQLRAGIKAGRQSPRLIVNNCVAMMDRQLAAPAEGSIFLRPLSGEAELLAEAMPFYQDTLLPAYQELRDFLKGVYHDAAPEAIGISSEAEGRKFYEQRIRFFTTYDVGPQEVYDTGIREVARIRKEMEAIIADLGFEGSFDEFLQFLREDPQFYATSPEELLKEAAWITKRMEAKLPKYFGHLPRMPLAVEPVPAALAPNYTGGRYSPGNYSGHRAGEFWVNTYDLPSRPLYVLPALALHEGAPGHHTQIMLAAELDNQPAFRKGLYLSAFGEGWGLYAEFLGKEAGIYRTPYEDFGRLTYEMWRACRLVVDPGMHYFGWDRDKAVDFLRENTALSLHEVNTEIDRYIGWPGQAVSYKMGELKIRDLRKRAEQRLGDRFDLRAFHDLVLANGAISLDILERTVVEWIEKSERQGGR